MALWVQPVPLCLQARPTPVAGLCEKKGGFLPTQHSGAEHDEHRPNTTSLGPIMRLCRRPPGACPPAVAGVREKKQASFQHNTMEPNIVHIGPTQFLFRRLLCCVGRPPAPPGGPSGRSGLPFWLGWHLGTCEEKKGGFEGIEGTLLPQTRAPSGCRGPLP